MSDKIFIGPNASNLDYGEPKVISKVRLIRSNETWFEAGDDTGDMLECSNPWATQAMADAILAELQGSPAYLPYTAADALIDPAAEIGDGVTIGGIYSEIVSMDVQMDGTYSAGLAAPGVDEVEDEYPYQSSGDREAQRENKRIFSMITKTDQKIRSYVANEIERLEAEFSITAGEIRSYVDDQINGINSTISQTASSLTAQIESVEGELTYLSLDLDGVKASVSGLEGDYTEFSVKLGQVESTVSDVEGNLSTVQQTVSGLEITTNGLSNGTTLISGDCIRTGRIAARYIEVEDIVCSQLGSGQVELLNASGRSVGTISIASSTSAISGQGLNISAPAIGLNATSGDVFLSSRGDATYLHVNTDDVTCKGGFVPIGSGAWNLGSSSNKWANLYAVNGTIQTSDRELKTDIVYDLSPYDAMFDGLSTCTYRMKDGGRRKHPGLIAQDVEQTMLAVGVSDMDFAGLIKSDRGDGTYDYALRYGEFIPLLIDQVQKSKSRIADLESRVAILEGS